MDHTHPCYGDSHSYDGGECQDCGRVCEHDEVTVNEKGEAVCAACGEYHTHVEHERSDGAWLCWCGEYVRDVEREDVIDFEAEDEDRRRGL